MTLGLTAEQIADRCNYIGGSDAGKIMSGRWLELWEEKTGRVPPPDLSGVLAVQLGLHTERLNLDWFERTTGYPVSMRGAEIRHPYYGYMRCHLDGATEAAEGRRAIVQAKFTSAFTDIEAAEQRYMAQLHHEMLTCGCDLAFLSVITGKPSYELVQVERNPDYAALLLQYEEDFWSYVEADEPPPDRDAIAAPVKPSVFRVTDMCGSNLWAEHAGIWRETIAASRRCDKAAKELRSMVEPDVGEAFGHGVRIVRSKSGALLIREA